MQQKKRAVPVLIAAAVAAGVGLAVAAPTQAASETFTAQLSGDAETPAVETRSRGVATFKLSNDGSELTYRLIVANIEDVLMAHIHMGPRDAPGGVVVWLYPDAPPPQLIEGRTQGTLATGTITDGDLVGALAGMTLEDLVAAIEADMAYVNVHTSENPGGEVRGHLH